MVRKAELAQRELRHKRDFAPELKGGSEAQIIKIRDSDGKIIIRKSWHEDTLPVKWSVQSTGNMSSPIRKALLQIDYLRNISTEISNYFPKVLDVQINKENNHIKSVSCDLEYLEGITISDFIHNYSPPSKVVSKIYQEVFILLSEHIHSKNCQVVSERTITYSHMQKIRQRLMLVISAKPSIFKPLTNSTHIFINGKKYINIPTLITLIENHPLAHRLEPKHHSLVHGDTNTENIIISKPQALIDNIKNDTLVFCHKTIGIKFLDPRAIGFKTEVVSTISV